MEELSSSVNDVIEAGSKRNNSFSFQFLHYATFWAEKKRVFLTFFSAVPQGPLESNWSLQKNLSFNSLVLFPIHLKYVGSGWLEKASAIATMQLSNMK